MNPITIPPFDVEGAFTNPQRSLMGVVDINAVTYDVNYTNWARWLFVGTTGNITIVKIDGTQVTLPNVAAGFFHPIHHIGIASSGTTVAANQLFWGN